MLQHRNGKAAAKCNRLKKIQHIKFTHNVCFYLNVHASFMVCTSSVSVGSCTLSQFFSLGRRGTGVFHEDLLLGFLVGNGTRATMLQFVS